jgi:hypothetical protein
LQSLKLELFQAQENQKTLSVLFQMIEAKRQPMQDIQLALLQLQILVKQSEMLLVFFGLKKYIQDGQQILSKRL